MLSTLRSSTHASPGRRLCHHLAKRTTVIGPLGCRPARLHSKWADRKTRLFTSLPSYRQQVVADGGQETLLNNAFVEENRIERAKNLPLTCPGCGAPSQTIDPEAAGFYGSKRVAKQTIRTRIIQEEDEVFEKALKFAVLPDMPAMPPAPNEADQEAQRTICDRCHYLLYQSRGTSIVHPSMQSIQQIIEESPHRHNHIYHVLDAADFPMSLIPNLQNALRLPRLRTQNRRSKTTSYIRGRIAEVSFIITRSDLLAPRKEQVDRLVPYLREVLRDALGRSGRNLRLGNVRCVSAQRGWWTRIVKEDIWRRGGAGWMVGKVNVGKSALYEVVFPKGRNQEVDTNVNRMRDVEWRALERDVIALNSPGGETNPPADSLDQSSTSAFSPFGETNPHTDSLDQGRSSAYSPFEPIDDLIYEHIHLQETKTSLENKNEPLFDESEDGSLLPPAQPEAAFPQMPLVSALPGTTASPIRIPFGNGKGELIDLPGIHRTSLDTYIKPEHHKALVMKSRVTPEQYTVKPGQSILLGGVVRITPKTDDLVFLAYPFVPLKVHVTSHQKAVAIQTGFNEDGEPYDGNVESIATDAAKRSIKSAGTFQLRWDVTKRRTGSLTDKAAGKMKPADLPFIVYSADILIESVGWIELTCQVRSRRKSFLAGDAADPFGVQNDLPEVEVSTPTGKFVAVRRPMNAWVLGGPKRPAKHLRRVRPRQSISMARRKAGGALGQLKKLSTAVD